MKVTFLGTGTSHGVPVLGCSCPVCRSSDERDKRYRSSVWIEKDSTSIVIDTGYEFRLSGIRAGIGKLDAVLYTHAHSDHIMGFDDLRVFTLEKKLPVYASEKTLDDIKTKFPYAFIKDFFPGIPMCTGNVVRGYEPFCVNGIEILPIPLKHGLMEVYGYRIGAFAYLTDVSYIEEKAYGFLRGLDVLVIGALREKSHPTHLSFGEAVEAIRRIKPGKAYFTHINHETSYVDINAKYMPVAESAYDGMVLEV